MDLLKSRTTLCGFQTLLRYEDDSCNESEEKKKHETKLRTKYCTFVAADKICAQRDRCGEHEFSKISENDF